MAAEAIAGERGRWVQAGREDPDFGVYLERNLGPAGIAQYVREGVDLEDVRAAYANGVELEPGGFVHPNSAA